VKLSVSVSDNVGERLNASAGRLEGASVSLLAELGIQRLLSMPEPQVADLVRSHRFARRATGRPGWMSVFWSFLGDGMGRLDQISNPYAPRQYGNFVLVMLMNRADGREEETDPFPVRLWPATSTPESPRPEEWLFARTASPAEAAEEVANKLRDLGVRVSDKAVSKSYAIEKFFIAASGLAAGLGDIRERLESAAITLHVLSPERDFPEDLQERFASLWRDMTREQARNADEGRIQATIRQMEPHRAAKIVEEILRLYFDLLDITPFGNPRE
jgi:hypothetical protein